MLVMLLPITAETFKKQRSTMQGCNKWAGRRHKEKKKHAIF